MTIVQTNPSMTPVQKAKLKVEEAMENAGHAIFGNGPLAHAFTQAYEVWIRARWDEGDTWVRSVWTSRP